MMKIIVKSVIVAMALNAQTSFALRGRAKDSIEEHATALEEVLDSSPFMLDELLEEIDEQRELNVLRPVSHGGVPISTFPRSQMMRGRQKQIPAIPVDVVHGYLPAYRPEFSSGRGGILG